MYRYIRYQPSILERRISERGPPKAPDEKILRALGSPLGTNALRIFDGGLLVRAPTQRFPLTFNVPAKSQSAYRERTNKRLFQVQ